MKFSTEEWAKLSELLEQGLNLPAASQPAWVEGLTDLNATLKAALQDMLERSQTLEESDLLLTLPKLTGTGLSDGNRGAHPDLVPGTRVGAFTVVRRVGRGGMGAVYLATRADGSFEQSVAIKVIDSSNSGAPMLARFQQERQILARLNHPNIARLLDGGEMPSGLPYLVMEFVEGQEIDAYCDRRGLDLQARLRLFLQVVAAVQHAHQHLVVHRDLKPGNILIAGDGTPKLLDFGIAKVLDSEQDEKASTRIMTPEYASPEQVRGGIITTSADIYSLGAVLYRLLTGKSPHTTKRLSPLEAARQITEQPVPRATGVPADVAAILEKALHKDPAHRYQSANDLSDEIHRFLEGKPVLAVPDSFAYRAVKSLRRHWIPASALAAVLLTLVAGTVVSLWQARKAERRFSEVRQLSNRFLFEFEGAIHGLPGATKARQLVVKTAQEYLERLAAEEGPGLWGRRDPALAHELAEAYRKLGDVQGNPVESNAGDSKAALASYRKALALRESAGDEKASDTKLRMDYLTTIISVANAEAVSGDSALALRLHEKSVALAQSWIGHGTKDADLLNSAGNVYSQLASQQRAGGDVQSAVTNSERSLELQQKALALRPADAKLQRAVAVSYWAVAAAEKLAGRAEEAVASFTTTVELLRRVAAANPGDARARRELLGASWLLAGSQQDLLIQKKQSLEAALPLWEDALRTGTQLLNEDPGNALVESDMTLISLGLANLLQELHRPEEALKVLAPAIARQETRHKTNPESRPTASYLAIMWVLSADCYKDLGKLPQAKTEVQTALAILDLLVKTSPGNVEYQLSRVGALQSLGDILAGQGDYQGARSVFGQGLEAAGKMPPGPSAYDPAPLIAHMQAADALAASKLTPRP